MKNNKFFNNLESELQDKYKNKKISIFDGVLAVVIYFIVIYKIISSSFIFFYSNYILYAIFLFVLWCILLCYFFPKKWKLTVPTDVYNFLMPILALVISFWIIPRSWHYIDASKKEICIDAKLIRKLPPNNSGDGIINFDIRYDKLLPKELISLGSLSGLSYEEYMTLPAKGSKIKICGDISKVGYTYTHIEAIN